MDLPELVEDLQSRTESSGGGRLGALIDAADEHGLDDLEHERTDVAATDARAIAIYRAFDQLVGRDTSVEQASDRVRSVLEATRGEGDLDRRQIYDACDRLQELTAGAIRSTKNLNDRRILKERGKT